MRERGLKRSTMSNDSGVIWVAPHAGAWIETIYLSLPKNVPMSLPMRERGLKLIINYIILEKIKSLPMRERGLKRELRVTSRHTLAVAPHAGAWIETARQCLTRT